MVKLTDSAFTYDVAERLATIAMLIENNFPGLNYRFRIDRTLTPSRSEIMVNVSPSAMGPCQNWSRRAACVVVGLEDSVDIVGLRSRLMESLRMYWLRNQSEHFLSTPVTYSLNRTDWNQFEAIVDSWDRAICARQVSIIELADGDKGATSGGEEPTPPESRAESRQRLKDRLTGRLKEADYHPPATMMTVCGVVKGCTIETLYWRRDTAVGRGGYITAHVGSSLEDLIKNIKSTDLHNGGKFNVSMCLNIADLPTKPTLGDALELCPEPGLLATFTVGSVSETRWKDNPIWVIGTSLSVVLSIRTMSETREILFSAGEEDLKRRLGASDKSSNTSQTGFDKDVQSQKGDVND